MQLENQVCSLDLAKKLKDLGVRQCSYHDWIRKNVSSEYSLEGGTYRTDDLYGRVSAFTVAELGEMLPEYINWGQGDKHLEIIRIRDKDAFWNVSYYTSGDGIAPRGCFDKTEANARAKMLIYLLEQGLITIK